MEWVDKHVAVGSYRDADGAKALREEGVDLIVDARCLFDDTRGRKHRTPRLDDINFSVDLILANVLKDAKVLIRCHHGRDRAPFVAMVYLSRKNGIPYRQAYALIKEGRPRTVFHWDWVEALQAHTPGPTPMNEAPAPDKAAKPA